MLSGMKGQELRTRREALGLTQTQLAWRLGISLRALQEWESDVRPIRAMVALAMQELARQARKGGKQK
jgi:DNA-binding transcriptional regulator YiaG